MIVEKCNEIRAQEGLGALKISDYLMATSQANADYSSSIIAHSQQFSATGVGENLAWNWKTDLDAGTTMAFTQWYTNEKAIYDRAMQECPNGGSFTFTKNGSSQTVTLTSNWATLGAYELSQTNSDFYHAVGHYLNIIHPDYTVSGGAINTTGTQYASTYAQNFQFDY